MYFFYFLDEITVEKKEIQKRFVDVLYNLPKATKVLFYWVYNKTFENPINYICETSNKVAKQMFCGCKRKIRRKNQF